MGSLATIREQRRSARLAALRQEVERVTAARPESEVWLFGSLARGDWDAYSDVDLLGPLAQGRQAGAAALIP